jgi:predicted GNAT superfamily acetyltransferase
VSLDLARLRALNNAHATEPSWLEPARLAGLVDRAFFVRAAGDAEAFALAFDQDADYDSPNFLWLKARRLHDELFARARGAGHDRIVCEVNTEPLNPASGAFHAALGFVENGAAAIHGGARTVRYLERRLAG